MTSWTNKNLDGFDSLQWVAVTFTVGLMADVSIKTVTPEANIFTQSPFSKGSNKLTDDCKDSLQSSTSVRRRSLFVDPQIIPVTIQGDEVEMVQWFNLTTAANKVAWTENTQAG